MYISDWETFFEYEGMLMVVAGYEVYEVPENVGEGFEIDAEAEIYQIEEVDRGYEFVFYGIVPARIRKIGRKWILEKLELR